MTTKTAELSMERLHDVGMWIDLKAALRLSPRELDVAILLVLGHTAGEISRRLGIGKGSVQTYIDRLKRKAQCDRRSQLVTRILIESGLLLQGPRH